MFSKSDYKFFEQAKITATHSDFSRCRIGCVAVYKGVIVKESNTNKTHPIQRHYDIFRLHDDDNDRECELNNHPIVHDSRYKPKLHAEIRCLNSLKNTNVNFSKVKMYVYRIKADGSKGLARPCPACLAAIKDFGVKHIYYTTDDGFAYEKIG